MIRHHFLSILLVVWTISLGQSTSLLALAEQMHEVGYHSHLSSADAEQHQNGQCLSNSLLHCCAVAIVCTPPATAVISAHYFVTVVRPKHYRQVVKHQQNIRAPPVFTFTT
ncbi:hypothetical protein SNR37_002097 [Agarivorans aestuarii]|uniref:DUF2946 domain-containing protein n=1 Tax=Agarivorans aestuarii TaxID=1563703 RepID=A0ABU7FZV1_9ALTE|nr:hypothetical protein [Agarivorans aestuarii]MEE1672687.1 hypothetical protein [Agarivorans aestuarii]